MKKDVIRMFNFMLRFCQCFEAIDTVTFDFSRHMLDSKRGLPNYGLLTVWPHLAKFWNLGKKNKRFRRLLEQLFSIWQNCEPTLANIWYFWANFHCSKWPNIEIIIAIWSHWLLISRAVYLPKHRHVPKASLQTQLSLESHWVRSADLRKDFSGQNGLEGWNRKKFFLAQKEKKREEEMIRLGPIL